MHRGRTEMRSRETAQLKGKSGTALACALRASENQSTPENWDAQWNNMSKKYNDQAAPQEWRLVSGFPGIYEVSSAGNVRRIIKSTNGQRPRAMLRPQTRGKNYLAVRLYYGERKYRMFSVHRLVAEAFIPKTSATEGHVNHKNGIKTDNRLENLEWISPAKNTAHAIW